MSALLDPGLHGLLVVAVAMTLLWVVSLLRSDASIVDPFWAPGFLLACVTYVARAGLTPRGILVTVLIAVWAARLGSHLLRRNLAHGEDARYAAWRRRHGRRFWWVSLFTVFWLQAGILWVVSAPLLAAAVAGGMPGFLGWLGAAVFAAGFGIEWAADRQLRHFRARDDSRGRVLDTGLWGWSRHPNYFGNAVLWWGLWLIAADGGGWWSIVGPVVMTVLLLRVSGVTLLERDIEERRPEYADYRRRTSAFVPRPPKRHG